MALTPGTRIGSMKSSPRLAWAAWVYQATDTKLKREVAVKVIPQCPGLEANDVRACMAYAAEMTRERMVVTGRGVA